MGIGHSSPLAECLDAVCANRAHCVAYPDAPLYQALWVKRYNLDIPVKPAAVILPDSAKDVGEIVKCARQNNVKVQAKSGGHSYGNFGLGGDDGAVAIDLANLKSFSMDNDTWQATLGAGLQLGELDDHLHDNGARAMAHGSCPGVGIGGHATIGGLGPMSRMWGSALDHVLEVQVVTAEGEVQRASETENADLFWALRGAGASFGVITEFVVKTHPEPGHVVEYSYSFSFGSQTEMAAIFQKWQDLVGDADLDRRFSSLFIAQPLGVIITGTFYGTEDEYAETGIGDRLPSGGAVDVSITDWLGHLVHQAEVEGIYLSNLATPFYSKSLTFRKEDLLDKTAISSLFTYMDDADAGTLLWFVIFNSEGGATSDVAANATAYAHRDKIIVYQSYGIGIPSLSTRTRQFLDGVDARIREAAPGARGVYAGYVDPTLEPGAAQEAYWGAQLPRLRGVKRRWDPDDVFHNPQSVRPADE